MNASRLAALHSLAYLLPLTLWLCAQLEISDWTTSQVQAYFHDSVLIILAAQCLGMTLLFSQGSERTLAHDLNGLLLMLLFPLPLLALSWLSGALLAMSLLNLCTMVVLVGILALTIRRGIMLFLTNRQYREPVIGMLQIGLLILLWHYHDLWLNGSGL